MPEDGRPIVDGRGFHSAQGRGGDFKVRELFDCRLDHRLKSIQLDGGNIVIHALDLEAEGGSEVLFIADHHIHIFRDLAIHLTRFV